MKSILLSFAIFILSTHVWAQSEKELTLNTSIKAVTVYEEGAQINREGSLSLPSGESTIRLKGLSPYINENSIRVKITGAGKLVAVHHEMNYLKEQHKTERVDSLYKAINAIEKEIDQLKARKEVLAKREELLGNNQQLGSNNAGASLSTLQQAMQYYEQQYTAIKQEQISIQDRMEELHLLAVKLRGQIVVIEGEAAETTGEIVLKVDAVRAGTLSFSIDYIVQNAGWTPRYDLRVADVASPLELTCKADVFQNTGVAWKDVTLTLSNGNPNESGIKPELNKWSLTYARWTRQQPVLYDLAGNTAGILGNTTIGTVVDNTGEGLPGVNVVVKGTTTGTVTDLDGNFKLDVPPGSRLVFSFVGMETLEREARPGYMSVSLTEDVTSLSEVVVTAMGAERSRGVYGYSATPESKVDRPVYANRETVERQTTVEYLVNRPYTVSSTGESIAVDLEVLQMEAIYEYYAVPKMDKDAFLIARVPDWDKYNLPGGAVNLYFEDAFIGESVLAANTTQDTLDISLGRDKSIVITREKKDEYTKRSFIGSNKTESRAFAISVRNRKSQDIKLTIYDQVPVSVIDKIEVTVTEISGAVHDEREGELTWTFDLPAGKHKEFLFGYEVKYPKNENLILE